MSHLLAGSIEDLYNKGRDYVLSEMEQNFRELYEKEVSNSEKNSWKNSLYIFIELLKVNGYGQLQLIAEYSLINKIRIDAILLGYNRDKNSKPLAIIVELKQWSTVKENNIDDSHYVNVDLYNGNYDHRLHPIQQTMNYERIIKCHHSTVNAGEIIISSIQYLHNYDLKNKYKLFEGDYDPYIINEPFLFVSGEEDKLIYLLDTKYSKEQRDSAPSDIFLSGKYTIGKQGFEAIESILNGKVFAAMKDDQMEISLEIAKLLKSFSDEPRNMCIVVTGSAGTGKTYIGMNALRSALKFKDYFNLENIIFSFSRNRTLKEVLEKESKIDWPYLDDINTEEDIKNKEGYKLIVVDEAHRMENIDCSLGKLFNKQPRIVVILQDDYQRVRITERGTLYNICKFLDSEKIPKYLFKLESQKRSGEQGDYVQRVQSLLFNLEIKNPSSFIDFEINTSFSLSQIDNLLKSKLNDFTAKWYASFDWVWETKKIGANPSRKNLEEMQYDIAIDEWGYRFRKYWNPSYHQYEWYKGEPRIIQSKDGSLSLTIEAIDQVGCVYTAQGLDYDYIGLIWFKGLTWNNKKNKWEINKDEIKDGPFKEQVDDYLKENKYNNKAHTDVINILLNQYYILLTRARKGIYIWFEDKATKQKFDSILNVK